MVDYSTTAGQNLILFSGGGWARNQLHASRKDIPMRSILMEIQAGDLQGPMADYSTTAGRIPILFVLRLLGSTPATRRYKIRLCRTKTDGIAVFCEGGQSRTGQILLDG